MEVCMHIHDSDPRIRLGVRGGRLASLVETGIKLKRFYADYASHTDLDNWQIKELFDMLEWLDDVSTEELVNLQILCKSAWDKAGETY